MTPSDAPTNTERCGGEVEAWVAMVEAEPHDFTAQERIAAGRMRKLFYALAEEHAKGERMAETIRTTEATLDSLNLDSRRALHRVIEDVIGINRAALVSP